MLRRGRALNIVAAMSALTLAACSSPSDPAATPPASVTRSLKSVAPHTASAAPVEGTVLGSSAAGVYENTTSGRLSPFLAGLAPRVYVPNEGSGDVVVIDPGTFKIVGRFGVGSSPEHVTPEWDLRLLYVNDMGSNALTVIDPQTRRPVRSIRIPTPYNLYFTPDGSKAIVVARQQPSAHRESGFAQDDAFVDEGKLYGAAADVDMEHAEAPLLRQPHRA